MCVPSSISYTAKSDYPLVHELTVDVGYWSAVKRSVEPMCQTQTCRVLAITEQIRSHQGAMGKQGMTASGYGLSSGEIRCSGIMGPREMAQ